MERHEADPERACGGAQIAPMMFDASHDDGAFDLSNSVSHIENRRDDDLSRFLCGDDAGGRRRFRRRYAIKRCQRAPATATIRRCGLNLLATTATNQIHFYSSPLYFPVDSHDQVTPGAFPTTPNDVPYVETVRGRIAAISTHLVSHSFPGPLLDGRDDLSYSPSCAF